MEGKVNREKTLENFTHLMEILDKAEGKRDTVQGAFSFLWNESFVREVVSSPGLKTSIAGLKNFFVIKVLRIFDERNYSNITYRTILAQLEGDSSAKKYRFHFDILNDCFDMEKNKEAMLEKCQVLPAEEDTLQELSQVSIFIPFLLMDRLRMVVRDRLRAFFELCGQRTCQICEKKSEVYFEFIQAVALYEIFYIEFVQERASFYVEESNAFIREMELELTRIREQGKQLDDCQDMHLKELSLILSGMLADTQRIWDGGLEEKALHVAVYQLLVAEFGISLNAMGYLLIVFEAMNVSRGDFRGLKNSSEKMNQRFIGNYRMYFKMPQCWNRHRESRYRQINRKLEEIMEKYGECQYDEAKTIYTFMAELCKPEMRQRKGKLRDLECMLGYPIYKELNKEEEIG